METSNTIKSLLKNKNDILKFLDYTSLLKLKFLNKETKKIFGDFKLKVLDFRNQNIDGNFKLITEYKVTK